MAMRHLEKRAYSRAVGRSAVVRVALACAGLMAVSVLAGTVHGEPGTRATDLPWRDAGIDQRTAAAHLLDRFAFGPRPGQVDAVARMGLGRWLEDQLAGPEEPELAKRLAVVPSLRLTSAQMRRRYRSPASVRKLMEREGVPLPTADPALSPKQAEAALTAAIASFARDHKLLLIRRLIHELAAHKLLRAVYAEGQLHEVLTDFWFNHFNVSLLDTEIRTLVTSYERDAIRPFVTGSFRTMLEATAGHPAMLLYLDNARSFAEPGMPTAFNLDAYRWRRKLRAERGKGRPIEALTFDADAAFAAWSDDDVRPRGLNENYARELLELHTLGVDGGYDEGDILDVSRAFTGWSVVPTKGAVGDLSQRAMKRLLELPQSRFERNGLFLFRADAHDTGEKSVLGHQLPAGRGLEDGRAVLDILSRHPSTAWHIARKLAIRFVSDAPPAELIDDLAATFLETGGDLAAVIRALAHSSHFWSDAARRNKIKLPFELAVSALRALDAEVERSGPLLRRVAQLGQRLYAPAAPTGYPDQADTWVSSGSLLGRMNLGLDLAAGDVDGIRVNVVQLAGKREPASLEEALRLLAEQLLPGRDTAGTVALLRPLAADPSLPVRVADRAQATLAGGEHLIDVQDFENGEGRSASPPAPRAALAYLAGLILGSPEFQRR